MSCHKEKLLRRASAGLAVIIASSAMVTGCGKAQESYTVYGGTNEESLVTDETFSSRFSTMEYAEEAEPESTPYGNTSETAAESGKTGETRKRKTIREDVSLVDNPEQRRVLIVVPEGSKVDVLKDKEDGWYKIRYRGTIGYVRSGYFVEDYEAEQEERRKREEEERKRKEEEARKKAEEEAKKKAEAEAKKKAEEEARKKAEEERARAMAAGEVTRKLAETVNLRDPDDPEILFGIVPHGSTVTVLADLGDGWYLVDYDGMEGMIKGGYFTEDDP